MSCGVDARAVQERSDTIAIGGETGSTLPGREELQERLGAATRGEFEILGELGRGGMATVFLARDSGLGRKVAIKVMSPELVYGEGMVERFKREARTAGGLSHPHIIPIHAVRETGNLLFFVMTFVEGRPLDSILKELRRLPIRMVQAILTQVGSALYHAHRHHVVHRDIKPANIMLDEEGYAVVTDFGIAKVDTQKSLTQTGSAVGTPYYMSPEQCAGHSIGCGSDQYSLGVVGYEMLAGRVPFHSGSVLEVMKAHFSEPPPPIEGLRPDCPRALARAVMRMLAKDPEQRFPTLNDVVHQVGSAPLDKDDPVRTQMVELAKSGERGRAAAATAGRTPTPRQARPAVSVPAQASPPAAERPRHPTPGRARPIVSKSRAARPLFQGTRWLIPVALGLLAAAGGWLAVMMSSR
jgi:serine/threonine-protein kinase